MEGKSTKEFVVPDRESMVQDQEGLQYYIDIRW